MTQTHSGQEAGHIVRAYESLLADKGFVADPSQRTAIQRLQQLADALQAFDRAQQGLFARWFRKPRPPRGVYLWGGVGRGKSFVMDCFFDAVPVSDKRRVHFHAFMKSVQEGLRHHSGAADPLSRVVDEIAAHTRLLCFDEFHVSDIADAMILGRLLEALLARNVVFVMTSNYPPDGLYPNGLQRVRFLPTIELLNQRFDVLEVDHGTDYRLRALVEMDTFLVPCDAAAEAALLEDFQRLTKTAPQPDYLELLGRKVPVRGAAAGVIWFDFQHLCAGPRSQNDYLELASRYHTLLLSGIPKLGPDDASEARRLTWLIDVLYDHRVNLLASAEVPAEQLYVEGQQAGEFQRTVSRLREMRGRDYLAAAHRCG